MFAAYAAKPHPVFSEDNALEMLLYLWPLVLVVFSNVVYNISSKSVPANCSPFIALIATYLTAAALSFAGYFLFDAHKESLWNAVQKINWSGFLLGISMVGLEIGYIFIYRAGWKISAASLVTNILLAVALVFIGMLCYGEKINFRQLAGIGLCLAGAIILTTARE